MKLSHYSDLERGIDMFNAEESPLSPEFSQFLHDVASRTFNSFPTYITADCPADDCTDETMSVFLNGPDEVLWGCPSCGENGSIRNFPKQPNGFVRLLRTILV